MHLYCNIKRRAESVNWLVGRESTIEGDILQVRNDCLHFYPGFSFLEKNIYIFLDVFVGNLVGPLVCFQMV